MPISSLVLALEEEGLECRARVVEALARDARIQVGEARERWLPVVTETERLEEAEALAESLEGVPGVSFVHVVRVDFAEGT